MLRHGTYPQHLSELSLRVLRAVWLWAEALTGAKVGTGLNLICLALLALLAFWTHRQDQRLSELGGATVVLIEVTMQQNEILARYAERTFAGPAMVRGSQLPSLYGE